MIERLAAVGNAHRQGLDAANNNENNNGKIDGSSMSSTPAHLAQKYFEAEKRPATTVKDFVREPDQDNVVLERDGNVLAFVVPHVLTDDECDDLIASSEDHGIVPNSASTGSLRTAKRSDRYFNEALSNRLSDKLKGDDTLLMDGLRRARDGMGDFFGLHSNWRVLRYDPDGDKFGAHQDQMGSLQVKHEDGTKDFVVSSHTLLINLSRDGMQGGATRFYPNAKVMSKALDQYETSVDVFLPRGWALVFHQKGMIHAGQPVTGSASKYVAQAGVLRLLPVGKTVQPSVFRLAPGLPEVTAEMNGTDIY